MGFYIRKSGRRLCGGEASAVCVVLVLCWANLLPKGAGAVDAASWAAHDLEEVSGEFSGGVEFEECEGFLVDAVDGLCVEFEVRGQSSGLLDDCLGDSAAAGVVSCGIDGGVFQFPGFAAHDIDAGAGEHGAQFLEAEDVVHAFSDGLHSFCDAGADEDYLRSGVFGAGEFGGEDHWAGGIGDVLHEIGQEFPDQLHVCGAAGGGHQPLSVLHAFPEFAGFVFGGLFGAEGDLHDIGESQFSDGGEELFQGSGEL